MPKTWSPQQEAIFADAAEGSGHVVVQARAGCGKTTTAEEMVRRIPAGQTTAVLAFGSAIAAEVKGRLADTPAAVSTCHALGLRLVQRAAGKKLTVDRDRSTKIAERWVPSRDREAWRFRAAAARLVSLAKGTLVDDAAGLVALLDTHDLDTSAAPSEEALIDLALRVLEASEDVDSTIDFDDMIWLPARWSLTPPKFDRVVIDETQDLSPAQMALVLGAVRRLGRLVAVGDDRQSIYGFRGAGVDNLGRIVEQLSSRVLPLNITYRCPRKIVELAREIVPDFTAAPEAPEGIVREGKLDEARPGDFVISRTNAPLVSACLRFLREGRPAWVAGRDLGRSLAGFVRASQAVDVHAFRAHVSAWSEREMARLEAAGREVQAVADKAATLLAISEGAPTVAAIEQSIERLFADKAAGVRFTSTHQAKGLEADRCFVLRGTYRQRPGKEEENLYYVAITRAKKELVWV